MSTSMNTIQTGAISGGEFDKRPRQSIELDLENQYAKKRAGRKAIQENSDDNLSDDPASKRKAQNRAAQKAFRERKLNHIKILEQKIQYLQKKEDERNLELLSENEKLKQIVAQLEKEKALLLGASISIDYIQQQQQNIEIPFQKSSSQIVLNPFDAKNIQPSQYELQLDKFMNTQHIAPEEQLEEITVHTDINIKKSHCPTPEEISKAWDVMSNHPRFDEFDHKLICSEIQRRMKSEDANHSNILEAIMQEFYPVHDFLK